MTQHTPGVDGLVGVYSASSGRRTRVPAEWIGHPVLGKDYAPTPEQLQIDGTLGPIPSDSDKIDEIRAYADAAGIDTGDARSKVELVAAIQAAFASGPFQVGVVLTPLSDPTTDAGDEVDPTEPDTQTEDVTTTPTETPAAGGQE